MPAIALAASWFSRTMTSSLVGRRPAAADREAACPADGAAATRRPGGAAAVPGEAGVAHPPTTATSRATVSIVAKDSGEPGWRIMVFASPEGVGYRAHVPEPGHRTHCHHGA